MQRFKTILLALPAAEAPGVDLSMLIALAKANGAAVRVLSLDQGNTALLERALVALGRKRDLVERVLASQLSAAVAVAKRLSEAGVKATAIHRPGRPFLEAIAEAMAVRADLIVVPSAELGRPATPFELHLIRKAPCPVWVTRPTHPTLTRILCAVDPVPGDAESMDLAHSTLRLARTLAAHFEAQLTLLHCWQLDEITALRSAERVSISEEELTQVILAAETDAEARLDALAVHHDLGAIGAEVMLDQAAPAEGIARAAETMAADLVVMGTVGRGGIPGLFIGNTAEAVMGALTCPILAVKPEGFVSPVDPRTPGGGSAAPTGATWMPALRPASDRVG